MNNGGFISVFNPKIIFQSWVDSMKIFLPANLVRFIKGTFKSFVEGVKAVATQVLWRAFIVVVILMAATSLFSLIAPMVGPMVVRNLGTMMVGVGFVIILVSLLAWIAAIRSTKEPKNYAYFKKYIFALPGIALIVVVWFAAGLGLGSLVAQLPYMVLIIMMESFFLGLFLTIFFFIESNKGIIDIVQSFWHSCIFGILNVPGLAILMCLSIIFEWLLGAVADLFPETIWVRGFFIGISIIEIMISTCILYNYFIVRVNENKSLYS